MNVYMSPSLDAVNNSEGGINTIVRAYYKHLPAFGVTFVDDLSKADVQVVHAGMEGSFDPSIPLVNMIHGLHWTADYQAKLWEYETNRDVIHVLRHAKEVTVPSNWVADTLRRDLRLDPYIIGHGVDWADWQHTEPNEGYVIWAKNRNTDVCDPTPVNVLAKRFSKRLFLTTFAANNPTPNVKVTGLLTYADAQRAVQRSGVYLATTKETFGIGILEAMAAGKPILGFAHGGILDLVEHGETGYLARPGDYEDLATGLSYCFRHAKRLGKNARLAASTKTWANVCQDVFTVLDFAQYQIPSSVSVVIPIFNKKNTLTATVESVLNQTNPPDEIILVDNNSFDGSDQLAKDLANQHGLIYLEEKQQGVAYARNAGISYAVGKYIVCLDADDKIEPNYIEVCSKALEKDSSLGVVYTSLRWQAEDGTTDVSQWPGEYNYDRFIDTQNQVFTAAMFRREAWRRTGGYRQRYAPLGAGAEDCEFWFRLGAYGWGAKKVSDDPLFVYSVGTGATSQPGYAEPNWRAWHPWVRDNQHPFASLATPVNKLSHPVRQYDQPLVSVVIPVSPNHLTFLSDALDSLEAQSFRNWEAIVVLDGIFPQSEIPFAFPYVKWLETVKGGSGEARNIGAREAKAPYLLFLDADDWLEPHALSTMLQFEQGGKSIVYSDYVGYSYVDDAFAQEAREQGRLLTYDERTKQAKIKYFSANYNRERAIAQPDLSGDLYNWNLVTSLVPKAWHDAIGGFDEDMVSWEDWDYWIRMAKCGFPFLRIATSLVNYRFYTGVRREQGLKNYESLLQYMTDKYEKESEMCCGGSSSKKIAQYTPPPPMSINMGVMQNMNGSEYQMVRLADGRAGDHRITGPATKTDYGYRSDGDQFLMHSADIEMTKKHNTRLQVEVLTLEEEPVTELEEKDPPTEEVEVIDQIPSVTALKGINAKTISLLEQAGLQTVKDVLAAGEEGLLPIKGIGSTLAQRVMESAQQTLDEWVDAEKVA